MIGKMKMGKINVKSLIRIFEEANQNFLEKNQLLFEAEVSERTLCGALMIEIHDIIRSREEYQGYFVDVEYNRNRGNQVESHKKMCKKLNGENAVISCDLILHSRGQNIEEDNLIELEMKKADRRESEKKSDRERLEKITQPVNETCIKKGKLPTYVCGYKLGIYYEIDFKKKIIQIEYYCGGERKRSEIIGFDRRIV